MSHAQQQFNVFQQYNVDEYLIAYGLCVDSTYRGRGVATEMLKARRPLLKALGLKVTTTAFTGIGSQKAAEKAGYEENFVIT
jgi:RimJ/RimL family protein N-acetyltransferase